MKTDSVGYEPGQSLELATLKVRKHSSSKSQFSAFQSPLWTSFLSEVHLFPLSSLIYPSAAMAMMMKQSVSTRAAARPASRVQGPRIAVAPRIAAPRMVRGASLITRAAADKEKVLQDVRGIISQQLGADLDKVTADSKFVDLGADSLDTVEIMMALEEKFEIQLDEEGAEKISTVQEAADMIAQQVSSKSA
ncbi:acyl carrier protein-like protein [Dunaliella salina]|uniref:Acyl carrier protein n=1 Tax=Dunaliella salina TaxID=3046 RepID=A0ABQ7GEF3_DUNSA|nr:acyl carrier protein-like protein [Dunaliella salina]|eukprot:KAF5832973.1 acyl carrier protein-like protein [Dunaliella salina]